MGVLSKLLVSFMPRSVAGLVLLVIPIAAAVVVWVSPRTLVKLFVKEDPQRLLEELTKDEEALNGTGEGKKKRKGRGSKTSRSSTEVVCNIPSNSSMDAIEEEFVDSGNEEEQVLQMAVQRQAKAAATKKATSKDSRNASNHLSGADESAANADADSDGWKRIPTKEEGLIASLRTRVQHLTGELGAATAEIETKTLLFEKEQRRLVEVEKESKEQNRIYNQRWLAFESELQNLKVAKADLETRLMVAETGRTIELEASAKGHLARIGELEVALNGANEENGKLATSKSNFEMRVGELEDRLSALCASLTEKETSINELEAAVTNRESEIQKLSSRQEKAEREAEGLRESLRESVSKLAVAEKEKSEGGTLQEHVASLASERDSLLENRSQLEAQLREAQERIAASTSRAEDAERNAAATKDALTTLETDTLSLQGKLSALGKVVEAKDHCIKDLEVFVKTKQDEVVVAQKTIVHLESELAERKALFSDIQAECASKQKEMEAMRGDLESTEQKLGSMKIELENARSALSTAAAGVSADEASLKQAQEECTSLKANIKEMQGELSTLKESMKQSLEERISLTSEVDNLQILLADSKKELGKTGKKLEITQKALTSKVDLLKGELEKTQNEKNALEEKISSLNQASAIVDELASEAAH